MNPADALFDAMADPTRRAAVAALIHTPLPSGDLARQLGITPQALTRHLRVLRRAGLVHIQSDATDARLRIYRIAPDAFTPLRTWLAEAERLWATQLAAFAAYAQDQ